MSLRPCRRVPAALLLSGALALSACAGGNATTAPGAPAAPTRPTAAAAPAAATVVGTALGAGGSGGVVPFDPTAYQKNAVEPGAQLRVSTWGDQSEQQVARDSLARFQQVYPAVHITYEPQPSDYGTKLLAQVTAGAPPDVFYLDVDLPYQLIPQHVLLDLTPALTEVGRSADDYFPSLMSVFRGPAGQVYGLPKDFTSLALFYNTDLVTTPPPAGWTQDDFTAWVHANTTGQGATRVRGFTSDLAFFPYWGNFALANGAQVLDHGKCVINSPAGVATLDWLAGLHADQVLTLPSDVGATWQGEAFAKKRAAAMVAGGWVNPFLTDPTAGFGLHYDAVPLPLGKTGRPATLLAFAGWGAAAQTRFPRAAAALVLFLTSRANEAAVLQTGFALPSLKGMENDPFFQGSGSLSKIARVLYAGASYGTPGVWGGAADPQIQKALNAATERVFARMQTGRQALDQACREIDAALAAVP